MLKVQELWGYFTRFTYLPILAGQYVLAEAIARGVDRGLFGYALGDGEALEFDTRYFKEPLSAQQVEIIESAWLVRPAIAKQWAPASEPFGDTETPAPDRPKDEWETRTLGSTQPGLLPEGEDGEGPEVPARQYKTVHIETPIPWENWYDLYNEVIDPLINEGADVHIQVSIEAQSDEGIDADTIELRIKESLMQRGLDAEIRVD